MAVDNVLPRHIAFILDGNGRWAEQRGLNRLEGHQAGVDATRAIVKALHARHIECATFYAFSTENWARPVREVKGLFGILERVIDHEAQDLHRNNIRVIHLMCSGAVDSIYLLKALIDGADGVLIGGCHPGDCHYQTGNYKARRRVAILKGILNQMGFTEDRIWLKWISASEGKLYADTVTKMTNDLKKMGPNPMKQLWNA